MSMKRIIVCDSGLGGLNIASRFFAEENKSLEACELIYLLIISKYMVLLNCMFMRLRAPGIVDNKVDIQGVRR